MKNVVFALCMVGMALVACNRSEGVDTRPPKSDPDLGGKFTPLPPTDYRPTATAPECGGLGQVCCSDGDGLVCSGELVCVDDSTCQDPNGSGDMSMVADMSTPDMGSGDSGSGADMTPAPDMSEPDDPECSCDKVGHGLGLGHCKEQHLSNSSGHGNGHCKYDCEL